MLRHHGFVGALALGLCMHTLAFAETVGVFSDATIGQIQFATGDLKTALAAKGYSVELLPLSSLTAGYANKKVVLANAANSAVTSLLTAQGGAAPTGIGEQAYALRTTSKSQTSYWVLGGDDNGAMYGGLQLAENISLNGIGASYDKQETPFMLNRGMKLNLPLDSRIPTYVGGWTSTSAQKAIPHVWDTTFWMGLLDQQARFRYNVLSIWVHHPFPALVKVADYPLATLPRIEGYKDGFVKEMDITQRIAFWRKIMTYAHNRGFRFYFFNWNVYADYAKDKYPGITESQSNSTTKDYMYKSLTSLIDTYPELDGFGISAGDGMSGTNQEKTTWTWDCFGKAVKDYLTAHPERKFTLIHRSIGTDFTLFNSTFAPLKSVTNATVNFSVKYAMAHAYSTPTPNWTGDIDAVAAAGGRTWLTVRNDDMFYLNWGDPKFVRDFMAGVPHKDVVNGFYVGSDIYNPTRTYFYKTAAMNGQLEVKRRWYMEMLWGRLSYNPQESDDAFKTLLAKNYPTVSSSSNLFDAWALASRSIPKVTELVQGTWKLDFNWYPEACYSDPGRETGFRTIEDFAGTTVANGSNLCSIASSAGNSCGGKPTSYAVADQMQADADKAVSLINPMTGGGNADLEVAITNVKQLASLSQYYAYKVRGATYKKAGQTANAKEAMGSAYCWWMTYSRLMDGMYVADNFRSFSLPSWQFADTAVLKEYTSLGGTGKPNCTATVAVNDSASSFAKRNPIKMFKLTTSGMLLNLAEDGVFSISIFKTTGQQVLSDFRFAGRRGANLVPFSGQVGPGTYIVRVKFNNRYVVMPTKVMILQ
jgi:hypothetical protein